MTAWRERSTQVPYPMNISQQSKMVNATNVGFDILWDIYVDT